MNRSSVRTTPPPSRRPPPAPTTLTIIMYGVPPEVTQECEDLARELRLGRVEVKHLQAACSALAAHPRAFLVAAAGIKPWDRQVLEEHADRADTTLRWVEGGRAVDEVTPRIRTWALEAQRRDRTARR